MTPEPAFFDSIDIYANQIAFIICACLGGVAHYLKKSAKGETTVSFHEWFGAQNLSGTIYTMLVFFFIIVGALAGDIINSHTGFWASLYTGFATGFAIDSGFNSDGNSITRGLNDVKAQTGALFKNTEAQRAQQPMPNPVTMSTGAPMRPSVQPRPQTQEQPTDFAVEEPQIIGGEAQDKVKVVIRRKPTE